MTEPYHCSSCGTSFDEQAPLVLSVDGNGATISCQHPGCGHSVTRPSLAEAFAAIGKKGEEKTR